MTHTYLSHGKIYDQNKVVFLYPGITWLPTIEMQYIIDFPSFFWGGGRSNRDSGRTSQAEELRLKHTLLKTEEPIDPFIQNEIWEHNIGSVLSKLEYLNIYNNRRNL